MKWSAHRCFLLLAFSLWCFASFGQKLKYNVYLLGNKIGEMTIERRDSAGCKRYALKSTTDAKLLFIEKRSAMSTYVSFDVDGKLISAFFQNIKDDETLLTKSIWESGKLRVDKNGEKTEYNGPVNFSSVLLYFAEPKNQQKVFSERVGKFFEIVKQADGTYLAAIDGHSAVYTYKAGKLVELEMKSTLGSITMKIAQ
jgi:hypothetical protein